MRLSVSLESMLSNRNQTGPQVDSLAALFRAALYSGEEVSEELTLGYLSWKDAYL